MKSLAIIAALAAALLLTPSASLAQGKPNNPDAPVVVDPPAPTPPPEPDNPEPAPPPKPTPPPEPDKPVDDYKMITSTDPATILDALKSSGYDGAMEPMSSGRPRIRVIVAGTSTSLYFYDCKKDLTGCRSLLISTAIDLKDGAKLADANKWNAEEVWGRVYLDGNGDPHLDVLLNTGDVLPWVRFDETMENWERVATKFKKAFAPS